MKRAAKSTNSQAPRDNKRRRADNAVSIIGVPPAVSAALVEAIRKTKSFFKYHPKEVIPIRFRDEIIQAKSVPRESVVSAILDRVEQSRSIESRKKAEKSREKMSSAIEYWLEALGKTNSDVDSQRVAALGCFHYTWKLQEHELPIVRRTSLYVCGSLLLKDAQCRSSWKEHLLTWTTALTDLKHIPDKYCEEMMVWQQEGRKCISEFVKSFPDDNKFQVALMCIEQRTPMLNGDKDAYSSKNMADWRRIRDIALKHGQKQCKVVEKMLDRAYACMDILMPRIGVDDPEKAIKLKSRDSEITGVDYDDDDDDLVDWEEGDEMVVANTHAAAVEQTLTLMQGTGDLQEGTIEIKFDSRVNEKTTDTRIEYARNKLQKYVSSLGTKHLPCLSSWVNSLSQADNLILKNGSLVAMCSKDVILRNDLMKHLSSVKRNVASVLSAASQLKIIAGEEMRHDSRGATHSNWRSQLSNASVSNHHISLSRSIDRRGRAKLSCEVTRRRSNQIQIKFNKK